MYQSRNMSQCNRFLRNLQCQSRLLHRRRLPCRSKPDIRRAACSGQQSLPTHVESKAMAPWISLALMILAGLGLVLRHDLLPVIGFDLGIASAAIGIAGLLMFTGRTDAGMHDPTAPKHNWRQPMIVGTLALLLFAGYTFATPLSDLFMGTNVNPSATAQQAREKRPAGRAALRLRRQSNGMFAARSRVNGSPTSLTVDTGAATIVLSAEDARRANIDVTALKFTVPVQTANGTVYAAPIQLERVFVGPLGAANVAALIARPGQIEFSVLGMSFLKRLRSYDIEGDHLTLEG